MEMSSKTTIELICQVNSLNGTTITRSDADWVLSLIKDKLKRINILKEEYSINHHIESEKVYMAISLDDLNKVPMASAMFKEDFTLRTIVSDIFVK